MLLKRSTWVNVVLDQGASHPHKLMEELILLPVSDRDQIGSRAACWRSSLRPLTIIVPWDEVFEREVAEAGDVIWTPPPPDGTCVVFDVVYSPVGVTVIGHPGARSMGAKLVGTVDLENGERVFVISIVREMPAAMRRH